MRVAFLATLFAFLSLLFHTTSAGAPSLVIGQSYSFRSQNYQAFYIRSYGYPGNAINQMRVARNDSSALMKMDESFVARTALTSTYSANCVSRNGNLYSLESVSNSSYYVTGFLTGPNRVALSPDLGNPNRAPQTWCITAPQFASAVPGSVSLMWGGSDCIKLNSGTCEYLRHASFGLELGYTPSDALFQQDATYLLLPGFSSPPPPSPANPNLVIPPEGAYYSLCYWTGTQQLYAHTSAAGTGVLSLDLAGSIANPATATFYVVPGLSSPEPVNRWLSIKSIISGQYLTVTSSGTAISITSAGSPDEKTWVYEPGWGDSSHLTFKSYSEKYGIIIVNSAATPTSLTLNAFSTDFLAQTFYFCSPPSSLSKSVTRSLSPSRSITPSSSSTSSPSPSRSVTVTSSPSSSKTRTASTTPSNTPSNTPSTTPSTTKTPSSSLTPTRSRSLTATPSSSSSLSRSTSPSPSASRSAAITTSETPSSSVSPSFSRTMTPSPSPSRSVTVTPSPSRSVTITPSPSRSVTITPTTSRSVTTTPTPSRSVTVTPSKSRSITPSSSPSSSPSRSVTVSPSRSRSPTATATVSPSETRSATPTISVSASSSVTTSPTSSLKISPSGSGSLSLSRSITPSNSHTAKPSRSNDPSPSTSATVTITPTQSVSLSSLAETISASISVTPSISGDFLKGITCLDVVCEDDGDPCTIEVCVDSQCNHQPISCEDSDPCTLDQCVNGACQNSLIPACASSDCRSIVDCNSCGSSSSCAWVECVKDTPELSSNLTSINLNNDTGMLALYSYSEVPGLQDFADVWFRMGDMRVYVLDTSEISAFGQGLQTFGACVSNSAVDEVIQQYETIDVTCDIDSSCLSRETNQLSAQIGSITTSVGVAGGGGVGCFCGSCLIAFLFFRRKKKKKDEFEEVKVTNTEQTLASGTFNLLFDEQEQVMNPLFQEQ
eukprot:TRINITY_DN10751_c0_g1_i1.p1 TRINITY_DN10751_c0_g1~~TRINITY_DN10751_c0_g1_i1.p1  ORF type:complete len:946 (+),score=127.91 TRINITY_DN10751_c0_g1_i1:172-3009(+)